MVKKLLILPAVVLHTASAYYRAYQYFRADENTNTKTKDQFVSTGNCTQDRGSWSSCAAHCFCASDGQCYAIPGKDTSSIGCREEIIADDPPNGGTWFETKTGLPKTKQPVILGAHRGGGETQRENELSAFEYSNKMGVDNVEFDVCLTSDDQLAIIHGPINDPDDGHLLSLEKFYKITKKVKIMDGVF